MQEIEVLLIKEKIPGSVDVFITLSGSGIFCISLRIENAGT